MYELSKVISLTLPILLPGLVLIVVLKFKQFNSLDIPIDLGATLNGKRLFGDNKTLKGVVVMMSMAVIVSYALYLGYENGYSSYINPIFSQTPILVSLIYSISYVLGELINSFIKRQMNIPAGKVTSTRFRNLQTFFDLSDGIIVTMFALLIFTSTSLSQILTSGFIGIFLHYATDVLMKRLSLK